MAELVADCSRCGSKRITFDLTQENILGMEHGWQQWYEAFCVCRCCRKASIFVLAQATASSKRIVHQNGLVKLTGAVNQLMRIEGIVSKKDDASVEPPRRFGQSTPPIGNAPGAWAAPAGHARPGLGVPCLPQVRLRLSWLARPAPAPVTPLRPVPTTQPQPCAASSVPAHQSSGGDACAGVAPSLQCARSTPVA
jgi:hypothetical protein